MVRNPKTITALLILAVSFVGGVNATEDELSEKQMRFEEQKMIELAGSGEEDTIIIMFAAGGGGGVEP